MPHHGHSNGCRTERGDEKVITEVGGEFLKNENGTSDRSIESNGLASSGTGGGDDPPVRILLHERVRGDRSMVAPI